MAYATNDVLAAMRDMGGVSFDRLRVDGGATVNNWLMQFQSDIIGVPVERPEIVETTALGAAGLAGIAARVWNDSTEFASVRKVTTFNPSMSGNDRSALIAGWNKAIGATLSLL
jgi:glycerol kinase